MLYSFNMKEAIFSIKREIENARILCGKEEKVWLVAAAKSRSAEEITQALSLGCDAAGENRVQELTEKFPLVRNGSFHFIGTLQRNKVKYLTGKVSLIQSVDSFELAQEIDKRWEKTGDIINVLIEVNIGREPQKGGVAEEELDALIKFILTKSHLRLRGFMAVLPIGAPKELYLSMRALYEKTKAGLNLPYFDILSMGMTDDYKIAVACGSNMVRIGRGIFGERK